MDLLPCAKPWHRALTPKPQPVPHSLECLAQGFVRPFPAGNWWLDVVRAGRSALEEGGESLSKYPIDAVGAAVTHSTFGGMWRVLFSGKCYLKEELRLDVFQTCSSTPSSCISSPSEQFNIPPSSYPSPENWSPTLRSQQRSFHSVNASVVASLKAPKADGLG